jgi:hypothetical protein
MTTKLMKLLLVVYLLMLVFGTLGLAQAETVLEVPGNWIFARVKPPIMVTYPCFCGTHTLVVDHRRDKRYPKRKAAFLYGAIQCVEGAESSVQWGRNGSSKYVTMTGCGRFHVGWFIGRVKLRIYKHLL